MQTVVKDAFLKLLRNALWDRPIEDWKGLSLQQWKDLYTFAEAHTLVGILYDALNALPEDNDAPPELLLTWVVAVQRIEDEYGD